MTSSCSNGKTPKYYFDIERVRIPHSLNSGWANVGGEMKGGKFYELVVWKFPPDLHLNFATQLHENFPPFISPPTFAHPLFSE